jgi:hypothetical protein
MAPKSTVRSFAKRLKESHSTVRSSFAGSTPFQVVLDARVERGKVADLGFETDAPAESVRVLNDSCALFLGKSQEECEAVTLSMFLSTLSLEHERHPVGIFAWNVVQDAIARLPFNNPMSKMIGRISQWHDEFPLGNPTADEED